MKIPRNESFFCLPWRFFESFGGILGASGEFLEDLGETWVNLEKLGGAWRFFGKFFWLNVYISVVFKGL